MRTIIVLALVAVLAALGGAGLLMLRRGPAPASNHPDKRMARALALRVALSIAIFLLVLLAWRMGWIQPRSLPF
jgi:predicted small integral membrane protein